MAIHTYVWKAERMYFRSGSFLLLIKGNVALNETDHFTESFQQDRF